MYMEALLYFMCCIIDAKSVAWTFLVGIEGAPLTDIDSAPSLPLPPFPWVDIVVVV